MRIAYLINQYPKVSHSFIRREILALERQGFEIMRISIRGWDIELVDDDDHSERQSTRYVLQNPHFALAFASLTLSLSRPIHFVRALALAWRMSRRAERPLPVHLIYLAEACRIELWLRKSGVKHLHAHFGTNSAEVAMLVHVLGGPPWSFTVHGPEEFDKPEFIGLAEKVRRCAFVVAVSSYGRSQLYRQIHNSHWSKVFVVHCGVDAPHFDTATAPAITDRPSLVCVGRLCEQKGQLLLIEAAHLLAERGLDFDIVLVGDGELRADIEASIVRHDLANRIRITGWISAVEVRSEILAARALVLPSFAEGLPVAIMEAMALKRPIISTFVAGIPELVIPTEHGWLVPAGDTAALADALVECLSAPTQKLVLMGEAARERVLDRHDVNKEAGRLGALFRKLNDDPNSMRVPSDAP